LQIRLNCKSAALHRGHHGSTRSQTSYISAGGFDRIQHLSASSTEPNTAGTAVATCLPCFITSMQCREWLGASVVQRQPQSCHLSPSLRARDMFSHNDTPWPTRRNDQEQDRLRLPPQHSDGSGNRTPHRNNKHRIRRYDGSYGRKPVSSLLTHWINWSLSKPWIGLSSALVEAVKPNTAALAPIVCRKERRVVDLYMACSP